MVLTALTGTALAGTALTGTAFAGTATHHQLKRHSTVPLITGGPALGATAAAPVEIPAVTLAGGASVALPSVTITDPGLIASGETVTLHLYSDADHVSLDTTATPTVTANGAVASAVTVTGGTVSFTVTKAATADTATYVVSGVKLVGTAEATSGSFGVDVTTSGMRSVATFDLGAVTHLLPAAAGPTAPDTAATVFDAAYRNDNHAVVLASDYEPQDAESANYLASALGPGGNIDTGILLTDPSTLSPAVTGALDSHPGIQTIYIVGGTSVVSAAIQTQLENDGYTLVRLGGTDQYATNRIIVNYVADTFGSNTTTYPIDYSQTRFNDTSGSSSPTATGFRTVKTAIVASGSITSFQDGIVSGPLSFGAGMPVILTTPTSLSATALALLTEGQYKQVILLGGPAAVSNSVESQLTASTDSGGAGVTAFRIAGQDASDTSTKLAEFLSAGAPFAPFAPVDQGSTDGGVLITRGTGFQDSLATGPYAGDEGATPILLTENATTLGAPLTAYLTSLGRQCVYAAQAVGGPLSVSPDVQQAAIDAEFAGLTGCVSTTPVTTTTVATAPVLDSVAYSTPGYASMTFDAPTSDGGSAITGYQYSVDNGATWTDAPPVSGSSPYTVIIPITFSDNYVRVRAVNGVGNSPESNEIYYSSS